MPILIGWRDHQWNPQPAPPPAPNWLRPGGPDHSAPGDGISKWEILAAPFLSTNWTLLLVNWIVIVFVYKCNCDMIVVIEFPPF